MFKKILIITDNLVLSQKFNDLINNLKLNYLQWSFAISPFSDKIIFEKELGREINVFNLKNNLDVDKIIDSYELVFSIHCKQLFPDKLVNSLKCINVHPGYNPINRGWYPQVFAIVNDLKIGATIHEIDTKLDHGAIIARRYVEKDQIDTSETLYNKIIMAEIELLEEHLTSILENTYTAVLPEDEGVLYLKNDFEKLCELDLDEKMTTLQFIDKLRSLTHGGFKNAYFIDIKTQQKIYVNINLERE